MIGGKYSLRGVNDGGQRNAANDRRSQRQSPFEKLARYLPAGSGVGLVLALFATVAGYGFVQGGHLDTFRVEHGEPLDAIARVVGLGINSVKITGMVELHEREVLAAAGVTPLRSLAFLDVAEMRQRLESVPMIKHASVSKLYPDGLLIGIIEREPQALWQLNGEVFVIAADGTVIDLMTDPRFARLPFVAGDGANTRSKEYIEIIQASGPLGQRIRAGILVSGRRWDIKFDNNMIVRLPELGSVEAMKRLVELESREQILEKDVIAIDLRQPDRIAMRLSEEGVVAMTEANNSKKPAKRKASEI